MTQAAADAPVLPYSSGEGSSLTLGRWRLLLWIGAVHLVVMLVLVGFSVPGARMMVEMLRDAPRTDWFVMLLLVHNVSLPVMMVTNALAVAGYAAAIWGRSPRRWFLIYGPTQAALIVLQYALLLVLASASPHQTSPTSSVGVSVLGLLIMPFAYVILNLPLFLLLFPRIRRACFAR